MTKKLSLIIPIFNEAQSLPELWQRVRGILEGRQYNYEVVFVNDGSLDNSGDILNQIAVSNPQAKVLHLSKNYGQTAAITAGLDHASGDLVILMDADLENHPEDIPLLLAKLSEGYDVVSGWRQNRWQGQTLTRKVPSQAANWLISKIARLKLNDYGCTLKAYRASAIKNMRLYGDMHRFIPAYLSWHGARIAEVPVGYTPRKYGRTKYGLGRTFKVLLDLVVLKFLTKYFHRPMHFFGGAGLISILLAVIAGGFAIYFKLSTVHHKDFIQTPLPELMALFFIVGVLFILMGLLAEILVRTYHEALGKPTHSVKSKINFE